MLRRLPEVELHELMGVEEVLVCSKQGQAMVAAELDKDGIDRADLYAMAAADVAYIGCFYVVGSVGGNRQDGVEAFEEFSPVFGA